MRKNAVITLIIVILVLFWTIIPMYWFGKMAFERPADISSFPPHFYPKRPTITSFVNVLGFSYTTRAGEVFIPSGGVNFLQALINSVILATSVTVITMIVVLPLSYTFGRLEFKHKNTLLFAIILSVALPPVSVLVPFYIIFTKTGLAGTLGGLIIVTLTITIPFVTWMLIGFFRNLPQVERLARIDGYSRFGTFIRIIIPMGKIGVVIGAIISFLFAWNEYTFALVMVNGTPAATIPPAISGYLFVVPEPGHLTAAIIYSLIPPFIVVYLLQKHITKMNIVEPLEG